MNYDFAKQIILNEEDKPMHNSDTDRTPFNAQRALARALLMDTPANAASKTDRFELYLKVRACTAATDFDVSEVAMLRDAAMSLPTLIAGQLNRILNQTTGASH